MILPLSYYAAALALNIIGAAGCAWIADRAFSPLGRLVAGGFAVALSLSSIGLILAALDLVTS